MTAGATIFCSAENVPMMLASVMLARCVLGNIGGIWHNKSIRMIERKGYDNRRNDV